VSAPLRLATRGSRLALAQTEIARAALGGDTEVVVVRTAGDRNQSTPVGEMEGQGWFTGELEAALGDGRADCGVHSAKDLPSELGAGLEVSAYLPRADCRDALITSDVATLASLPPRSRVGTSSARRAAFLLAARDDIDVVAMRGNVDTRLGKLDSGEVDAIVLAAAGLDRLGVTERITEHLDPEVFVPAPCQGAIALECVAGGAAARRVAAVDDTTVRAALRCERAVLVSLGGGCLLPLGAWARIEEGRLVCTAAYAGDDGEIRRVTQSGDAAAPEQLGEQVAAALR
jgi:hydroxymethylbilane synthase